MSQENPFRFHEGQRIHVKTMTSSWGEIESNGTVQHLGDFCMFVFVDSHQISVLVPYIDAELLDVSPGTEKIE